MATSTNEMIAITEQQMRFCEKHKIEYEVCYAVSREVAEFFKALAPDVPTTEPTSKKRTRRKDKGPRAQPMRRFTIARDIHRAFGDYNGRLRAAIPVLNALLGNNGVSHIYGRQELSDVLAKQLPLKHTLVPAFIFDLAKLGVLVHVKQKKEAQLPLEFDD